MGYEGDIDVLIRRLQEIAQQARAGGITFASSKLNDAGRIYEKYGYNPARLYLVSRDTDMERALVEVLDEIHKTVSDPVLGGLILKRLDKILAYEEGK